MVQFGNYNTNPQKGDVIDYQGKKCQVLSVEKWGTVIVDGSGNKIYVDLKNPIFESCKAFCQEQIDYYNDEYKKCSEKSKESYEEYNKLMKKAEEIKQKNRAIMAKYKKVTDPKNLKGQHRIDYDKNQKEYKNLIKLAGDAESVFEINNSAALDAAFSSGKLNNQMMITNAEGNSFGL